GAANPGRPVVTPTRRGRKQPVSSLDQAAPPRKLAYRWFIAGAEVAPARFFAALRSLGCRAGGGGGAGGWAPLPPPPPAGAGARAPRPLPRGVRGRAGRPPPRAPPGGRQQAPRPRHGAGDRLAPRPHLGRPPGQGGPPRPWAPAEGPPRPPPVPPPRRRKAGVAWPRPGRYGRYLDDAEGGPR